jgi:hypothetical protein
MQSIVEDESDLELSASHRPPPLLLGETQTLKSAILSSEVDENLKQIKVENPQYARSESRERRLCRIRQERNRNRKLAIHSSYHGLDHSSFSRSGSNRPSKLTERNNPLNLMDASNLIQRQSTLRSSQIRNP